MNTAHHTSRRRAFRLVAPAVALAALALVHGPASAGSGANAQPNLRSATADPLPIGDLPGWRQVFTDDFTTDVPLGSFPSAVSTKWSAYPSPWTDTSGYGTYSPTKVVSVANGVLTKYIHTEGGKPLVAALTPEVPGTSQNGLTYGRFAVRFRTDAIAGYKMAWLLWPDSGQRSEGEIDFPEMNLDGDTIFGYMHRTDATTSGDQAWFKAPAIVQDWHTLVIEWRPNLVVFIMDGTEVGRTSERVPDTAMHWVLQTETSLTAGRAPAPEAAGNVQIDWVAAWAYDPTTTDTSAPTVALTAPSGGSTLAGSAVTIGAAATDNVKVTGVQFKLDGVHLADDTTEPFNATWNTWLGANGSHVLTAIARDDAGNTSAVSVPVVVENVTDSTAPTALLTPKANSTIFPTNANLYATFSEAVRGVGPASFTLKNTATGAPVAAVVGYTVSTTSAVASLNPSADLAPDTKYTATLSTGIKDIAGNPLALTTWTFVTGPRPIAVVSPAAGATGVSRTASVVATFNESVTGAKAGNIVLVSPTGATVTATVTYDANGRFATLRPAAALAANTTYTATLKNTIKDLVGNPLLATTWKFTTGS